MKLIRTKDESIGENYLELHYNKMDEETEAVISRLDRSLGYIEGTADGTRVSVPVSGVLYFETVDRSTFAYTDSMCVTVNVTLRDILSAYADAGFVRISKSSIVNVYKIDRLQGDHNMRVIIFLKNGERVIMNRGYRNGFFSELKRIHDGAPRAEKPV